MRVAVVGCGAIGGTLAVDLATGRDLRGQNLQVGLYSRTPQAELTSEWPGGRAALHQPVSADPEGQHPHADWLLLCTKAHQVAMARPWLAALARPDGGTRLAIVQNGIDHATRVQDDAHRFAAIVAVIAHLPAERIAPGHVRQRGPARLVVADDANGQTFASLFAAARTRIEATRDFRHAAWSKLLWNAPVGGICALSLRDTSVLQDPTVRSLARELMIEICRVARADGVDLPDCEADAMLQRVAASPGSSWPSIAVDRREGRAMEWVARNAVVPQIARSRGVATPRNDVLVTLLRAANRRVADAGS